MLVGTLLRSPWTWLGLLAFLGLAVAASELRTALAVGAAVRANDIAWQGKLDAARSEEQARQIELARLAALQAQASAQERATAAEADRGQQTIVLRDIAASGAPDATCRFSQKTADALNGLRDLK